ncbi:MAG: InlB B-repeat-containing protein, partial [Bacilli bacterium]
VKENYSFMGWNTKFDGKGVSYSVSAQLTLNADLDLYAIWQENAKFTIKYHGNGNTSGSAPVDTKQYYAGSIITILEQGTLKKSNYNCLGWNTKSDGKGTLYSVGTKIVVDKNIDLYANWKEMDKVTITYNGNGSQSGTVFDAKSPYYQGNTVTFLDQGNLVKTNYSFKEWNTKDDGQGTSYQAGTKITINENIVLYAIWQENAKFSIKYDGNTNSSGSAPLDNGSPYYVGSNVVVLGNETLLKEDY